MLLSNIPLPIKTRKSCPKHSTQIRLISQQKSPCNLMPSLSFIHNLQIFKMMIN